MAESHYNQTWVKLNATWSNGYRRSTNNNERDDSIYWRNCPQKPYGISPFLVDGDIAFDINGTKALVGQDFIGESDAYNTEADIRGNETPFNFSGNLQSQGVSIPPPNLPPLSVPPQSSPFMFSTPQATPFVPPRRPTAQPFVPQSSASTSSPKRQRLENVEDTISMPTPRIPPFTSPTAVNTQTQTQRIEKPQRFLMYKGRNPESVGIISYTQGMRIVNSLGLNSEYKKFKG